MNLSTVFSFTGIPSGRAGAPRSGASALPCLNSNNSTELDLPGVNKLTGGHRKTAYKLQEEIGWLAVDFGLQNLGFLTLTFRDHVTDIREAQRRFNSLNTHVLKTRYKRAIGCWERQKSGRIHFHLVVVLGADVRTGFDFEGIARSDYRSASKALRSEWAFWRSTAPKYGFGRTELLPIRSTAEGIAHYVGKYVSKHIEERWEQDKGARVVRFIGYGKGERRFYGNFSWVSSGAWLWRQKLAVFAAQHGWKDTDDIKRVFGRRWAYLLQAAIIATELPKATVFPSQAVAERELDRAFLADVRRDAALSEVPVSPNARSYIIGNRQYLRSVTFSKPVQVEGQALTGRSLMACPATGLNVPKSNFSPRGASPPLHPKSAFSLALTRFNRQV